jgi:hypothetical protein
MDFSEYIHVVAGFYQSHPLIAIAGGIFLACLLRRNPKFLLSVLLLAFVLALILQFILKASSASHP